MRSVGRLPLPLVVVAVGLVVAGLHSGPGPAVLATAPAAAANTYAPPARTAPTARQQQVRIAPTAPQQQVRIVPRRHHKPRRPRVDHAATRRPAVYVTGPTHWSALNAAIARIPTYRAGAARWLVSSKYDFWGTADWYHDVLYVDPSVPTGKLYDVAVHEWSHELSVLDYHGDVAAATRAMNATFGGRGLTGPEIAADCMAILQGAGWTHYTTCTDPAWRAAASRLIAGRPLR